MADTEEVISSLKQAISELHGVEDARLIEFSAVRTGLGEREVCIRYRFDSRGVLEELGE